MKGTAISRSIGRLKFGLFAGLPALLVAAIAIPFLLWWNGDARRLERGKAANQKAWREAQSHSDPNDPDAEFVDPREGIWHALVTKASHPLYGWHEAATLRPGFLEVDSKGYQFYRSSLNTGAPIKPKRMLIVGASVAFGTYASRIETTYFHLLGRGLEARQTPFDIDIFAARAWKSSQEIEALKQAIKEQHYDVVLILDGLNDVICGTTAEARYGEKVAIPDGSAWEVQSHLHDYEKRVRLYLRNIQQASELCKAAKSRCVIALQPPLFEKTPRSRTEEDILLESLRPHKSLQAVKECYQSIRTGLVAQAQAGSIQFIDVSRIYDGESRTVFADIWHFADFGHRRLAEQLAAKIKIEDDNRRK